MPAPTPPASQAGVALLTGLQQRIEALEVWVRLQYDSGWVEPALEHGWAEYGGSTATVAYRKIGSVVRLRGTVKAGVSGKAICELPEGFYPGVSLTLPAVAYDATLGWIAAYLNISATGSVEPFFNGSSLYYLGLDGASFTIN